MSSQSVFSINSCPLWQEKKQENGETEPKKLRAGQFKNDLNLP